MKRMTIAIILFVLLFTACGRPDKVSVPQMETGVPGHEASAKPTRAAESAHEQVPVPTSTPTSNTGESILDKALLAERILAQFDDVSLTGPELMEQLTFEYFDFTSDGEVDVVCYSPDGYEFNDAAFFTEKEGEPVFVPCDAGWAKYAHSYRFDGTFVIKDALNGGTGIQTQTRELLVYDGERIVATGAVLVMNERISAPDYDAETVGTITFGESDDYSRFVHEASTTGTETSFVKTRYVYDPAAHRFTATELARTGSSDGRQTTDNPDPNQQAMPGYGIEALVEGQRIGSFTLKKLRYVKNEEASFELLGDATLQGVIVFDEMWYEYVFTSFEDMLDVPILIDGNAVIKPEYASFDQALLAKLSAEEMAYLEEQKQLEVQVTLSRYAITLRDGTEGGSVVDMEELTASLDTNQFHGQ